MRSLFILSAFLLLIHFPRNLNGQKLIDEDFTDSIIDDTGAGPNGANWVIYGPGTALRRTNRRPFLYGLSNRIQAGGGGWADGAQWFIGKIDSVYFKVHKTDDVTLVRFTTFSDYCYKNNYAGVEVAFLEYRDTLCPHPDYCHDQSWETMNCYYTSPGKGGCPNQLETNVENTDALNYCSISAISYAHKNGYYDTSDLSDTQTSLVIWRNMKDQKKVNIEQWGKINSGDFLIDTHMVSKLDPLNEYSLFSYIQLTFFRGQATKPTSQYIERSGIPYNQIQIGISHLEAGITKCTDFNLDYTTDSNDAAILFSHAGATGNSAHLQSGDADNNDTVNLFDGNRLIAFWNDTSIAPSASGKYNPATGEIMLDLLHISYFHLEGPAGIFNGAAADFSGLNAGLTLDNDNHIGAITSQEWNMVNKNIGTVAAPGHLPSNLFLVVNYKGSHQRSGFRIPLDSTVFTGSLNTTRKENFSFYPNPAYTSITPFCNECFTESTLTTIYDMQGKTVYRHNGRFSHPVDIRSFSPGVYLLIINKENVIFKQKITFSR